MVGVWVGVRTSLGRSGVSSLPSPSHAALVCHRPSATTSTSATTLTSTPTGFGRSRRLPPPPHACPYRPRSALANPPNPASSTSTLAHTPKTTTIYNPPSSAAQHTPHSKHVAAAKRSPQEGSGPRVGSVFIVVLNGTHLSSHICILVRAPVNGPTARRIPRHSHQELPAQEARQDLVRPAGEEELWRDGES